MRLTAILFSASLFAVAASLVVLHVRAWNRAKRHDLDPVERRFAWWQFRRRTQASAMLGLVAVAIVVGSFIPHRRWPSIFVFFWFAVAMPVVWVLLLAIVDMFATGRHLSQSSRRLLTEQSKLRAELKRHMLARGNGHPRGGRGPD